jgi:hypothetical protein
MNLTQTKLKQFTETLENAQELQTKYVYITIFEKLQTNLALDVRE